MEQVPERFARLILEDTKPKVELKSPVAAPAVPDAKPKAEPPPPPPVRRKQTPPPVAPSAGKAGRVKAQKEVAASLSGASTAAKKALQELSSSLGSSSSKKSKTPSRRRGSVGKGRKSGQLAQVKHGQATTAGSDVQGSAVTASLISVESVSTLSGGGTGDGSSSGEAGSGSSKAYRSNASLLAVVRRYAPGIQFCYDNELKQNPGLRGKIIAALTLAPSGQVTNVKLVSDTVQSARMRSCVLAQIKEWRFPAISEGVTVFKTPFVFTPPQN